MDFTHELVLITGSSRGIGREIAYQFALSGATVILNSAHNEQALLEAYHAFLAQDLKCHYFFGNVASYEETQQLFSYAHQVCHRYPSIIINNAGISYVGLFSETTPSIWQDLITTNLNSAYNCCHIGTPPMIQAQCGCIINISSIWGVSGASCEVAYSTSKSALNGFTRALAKELGPSHVRVNAIACGWIDTAMTSHFTEDERLAFVDEIPLCRTGTPTDVAQTCLYLASQSASYMTGQVLVLDGGLL